MQAAGTNNKRDVKRVTPPITTAAAEAEMIQQPQEQFLIAELERLLKLSTLDGSEGHTILEDLAAAVRNTDDDPLRICSALFDAKQRLRALIADTVPREAINNAICVLWEKMR